MGRYQVWGNGIYLSVLFGVVGRRVFYVLLIAFKIKDITQHLLLELGYNGKLSSVVDIYVSFPSCKQVGDGTTGRDRERERERESEQGSCSRLLESHQKGPWIGRL